LKVIKTIIIIASHLPLLPFLFPLQIHIPCYHFAPLLVRSITCTDCALEAVTF